ncbi:hypothetical protein BDZ90DRAFT_229421 [Jaminaea rosea]|uniref:RRM domain-containing protein n=1 Tax=Jaminaea rosea TaxID=1569628 RepID=A0A316UYK6_9BASI|nr:hypothetical protein BDZ90DRAFT_229421 [Jaminaea rosea]PWN30396.1 hypothetical protein BDZ90DRAFT_229421 [Jaminaea rosea]
MSSAASSSTGAPKLTKKQKKAADFRSGAGSGGKKGAKGRRDEQDDVPEEDLLDDNAAAGPSEPAKVRDSAADPAEKAPVGSKKAAKKAAKAEEEEGKKKGSKKDKAEQSAGDAAANKKRKRFTGDDAAQATTASSSASSSKAKKTSWDEDGEAKETDAAAEDDTKAAGKSAKPSKLIVFVGNMSFKSTAAEIESHFKSHCGETPSVRLLTTKSDQSQLSKSKQKSIAKGKAADTTVRSKGCAFLEFQTAKALQKALGLHHMLFGGRPINVELTAGGGGSKSTARREKIAEKNRVLNEERKKLHDKYVEPAKEKKDKEREEKIAKGEDVGPPRKKAKQGEEGVAQWGPKAAPVDGKKPKHMPRWMASGANAVRLSG